MCVLCVCGPQIADFGLSQLIQPGQKLTKVCGTWAYAAPEMADASSGGYDCKFDTWSFGVILFVVLCGYHPFDPEGSLPVAEVWCGCPVLWRGHHRVLDGDHSCPLSRGV